MINICSFISDWLTETWDEGDEMRFFTQTAVARNLEKILLQSVSRKKNKGVCILIDYEKSDWKRLKEFETQTKTCFWIYHIYNSALGCSFLSWYCIQYKFDYKGYLVHEKYYHPLALCRMEAKDCHYTNFDDLVWVLIFKCSFYIALPIIFDKHERKWKY